MHNIENFISPGLHNIKAYSNYLLSLILYFKCNLCYETSPVQGNSNKMSWDIVTLVILIQNEKKKDREKEKKHNQLPEMRTDGLQQASELGKEIYFAISVAFRAA